MTRSFDKYYLFLALIGFCFLSCGSGTEKLEPKAKKILAGLGFKQDAFDQPANKFSGGWIMRAHLAKLLVMEPDLLMLDEPTSGVASDEKFPIMDRVIQALTGTGVTILFVEHDMDIVSRYSEKVVAFYAGQVIANDDPAVVLADAEVKRYVTGGGA